MRRPVTRDIVFYLLATFLVWLMFYTETISLAHAIGKAIANNVYDIIINN